MSHHDAPGEPGGPGVLLAVLRPPRAPAATVAAHLPHDPRRYHRIISLCGSFPHRDHYYNRKTTSIGKALLDNPTMRFDLPLCTGDDGKVYFGHDPAKLWRTTQRAFDVVDRIDALINRRARRRSTMAQNYMTPKRTAEFAEIFRMFDK